MAHNEASVNKNVALKLSTISTHVLRAEVIVAHTLTDILHRHTLSLYQKTITLPGFKQYQVPHEYISQHYRKEIRTNIKGFLFTHIVLNYLMKELASQKIILANYPRLASITFSEKNTVHYSFEVSIAIPVKLKEWKNFAFKPPKRKNYKDLDKQVTSFLKQESLEHKKKQPHVVEENDWVCFQALPLQATGKPFNTSLAVTTFWLKIITDDIIRPLPKEFLHKKKGDSFVTQKLSVDEVFSKEVQSCYAFNITIMKIVKGSHLDLNAFKVIFKLKSKTDIHKKLIEVFSYRNDISQRKSIIEEVFHLFFSRHRFEVPKHIVIRKKEDILLMLKKQPDYHVYKMNKSFNQQLEMLAEKQLKEEVLIDQIAHHENITLDEDDIPNYLTLFNNERLKEFIYFKPSLEALEHPSVPIHPTLLQQAALREKTLNHVIHTLTK